MWKSMLHTDQLKILIHPGDKLMELHVSTQEETAVPGAVRFNHGELIQLIHTLLEINRIFRGDIPFYAASSAERSS